MKQRARMIVWWPNMDQAIKASANSCMACKSFRALSPVAPLHPWRFPKRPWARLHMDYGPVSNHMLLVIVNAYSKWIKVFPVDSIFKCYNCQVIKTVFGTHGISDSIVTDNSSPFVSVEIKRFLDIQWHNHHSSNGLAERAVQACTKKMDGDDII